MKITQYKTAVADDPTAMDKLVNDLIKEGYQPLGGLSLSDNPLPGRPDAFVLAQAMVKVSALEGMGGMAG